MHGNINSLLELQSLELRKLEPDTGVGRHTFLGSYPPISQPSTDHYLVNRTCADQQRSIISHTEHRPSQSLYGRTFPLLGRLRLHSATTIHCSFGFAFSRPHSAFDDTHPISLGPNPPSSCRP